MNQRLGGLTAALRSRHMVDSPRTLHGIIIRRL